MFSSEFEKVAGSRWSRWARETKKVGAESFIKRLRRKDFKGIRSKRMRKIDPIIPQSNKLQTKTFPFRKKQSLKKYHKYQKEYRQKPAFKAKRKEYNKKPEVKAKQKEYLQRPEVKARQKEYQKEYYQKPEFKAKRKEYLKEYHKKPEVKAKQRERMKEYRLKKKKGKGDR